MSTITQTVYARIQEKINKIISTFRTALHLEPTAFQYWKKRSAQTIPQSRIPQPGITLLKDIEYHTTGYDQPSDLLVEGPEPLNGTRKIINQNFPEYSEILDIYRRPAQNIDRSFMDFNKTQPPMEPLDEQIENRTLELVKQIFKVRPYQPLHWNDTRFAQLPTSTATGYYNRFTIERKKDAEINHVDFAISRLSKAWFLNTVLKFGRAIYHRIKKYAQPFFPDSDSTTNSAHLLNWFMKRPLIIGIRSHISKLPKLKIRPIYIEDDDNLRIEIAMFYPLLCQLIESTDSCLLYGKETIRGGMEEINRIAHSYATYIMLDWSSFDQLAPFKVIRLFYKRFIPSLLIVNHYYTPITNYNEDENRRKFEQDATNFQNKRTHLEFSINELSHLLFATRMHNVLTFLWKWYKSKVFVTRDGFGYIREHRGVPSGFLMTQIVDSFVNLFVVIYCMFIFGFTSEEITQMRFFILGDDNAIFSNSDFLKLFNFYEALPDISADIFGMKINVEKSIFTRLRHRIEILGYRNSYGMPEPNLPKLIAQLAYPERHVNDFINVHRSIGFAWAGAGRYFDFHELCRQNFTHYRAKCLALKETDSELYEKLSTKFILEIYQDIADQNPNLRTLFKNNLPGPLQQLITLGAPIPNIEQFPSIYDVRAEVSKWHGPLTDNPKWPRDYFTTPPFYNGNEYQTLTEIRDTYGPRFPLDLDLPS